MALQIRRQNVATGEESLIAGYGDLPIRLVVGWMEEFAEKESRETKTTALINKSELLQDGRRQHVSVLVEDGNPVVKYFIKLKG